jgi:hypothetical protein
MPRKKINKLKVELIPESYTINVTQYKNWKAVLIGEVVNKELTFKEKQVGYLTSSAGKALVERLKYTYKYQTKIARRLKKSKADLRTLAYLMPFYYICKFEIWVNKDTFSWEIVILKKYKLPDYSKIKD